MRVLVMLVVVSVGWPSLLRAQLANELSSNNATTTAKVTTVAATTATVSGVITNGRATIEDPGLTDPSQYYKPNNTNRYLIMGLGMRPGSDEYNQTILNLVASRDSSDGYVNPLVRFTHGKNDGSSSTMFGEIGCEGQTDASDVLSSFGHCYLFDGPNDKNVWFYNIATQEFKIQRDAVFDSATGAGNVKFDSVYFDVTEMAAPSAPSAGAVRFYADDSGGRTRLMARFTSGSALEVASEANAGDTTVTSASTTSLTNKTLDAEGTGNSLSAPFKINVRTAVCQNTAASGSVSIGASGPTPVCVTGSNINFGALHYPDSDGDYDIQDHFTLPSDWTSTGGIDFSGKYRGSGTTGNVVWQLSTICVADAETSDPAFNAAQDITDAQKGTALQDNDFSHSGVTTTGCAAGEEFYWRLRRQRTHASDTATGTLDLTSLTFTIRRSM